MKEIENFRKYLTENQTQSPQKLQLSESVIGKIMAHLPLGKDALYNALGEVESMIRTKFDGEVSDETINVAMSKIKDKIDVGEIKTMNGILQVFKDAKAKSNSPD